MERNDGTKKTKEDEDMGNRRTFLCLRGTTLIIPVFLNICPTRSIPANVTIADLHVTELDVS